MAAVGTIVTLAENAVGRTVRAATHPVESVAYAAGLARGTASVLVGIVAHPRRHGRGPAPAEPHWVAPRPGEKLQGDPVAAPVEPARPELDEDEDVETAAGTTGAAKPVNPSTGQPAPGPTGPLVDPAVAKEVRSESEVLRKAADPHKG